MRNPSVVFGLILLLGGCATLNEEQCRGGDWYGIGIRDGARGHKTTEMAKHGEACQEYGVVPDIEAYLKGHGEGLKTFCTPRNGYVVGKSGRTYYNVCPAHLEPAFYKQFELGNEIYSLERQVSRIYDEIGRMENRLDSEGDRYRRSSLRRNIRDLTRRRDRLQRKLTVLEIRAPA